MKKFLTMAAVASMAVSPIAAAPAFAATANPAASLSVSPAVRAGTPTATDSKLGGGAGGIFAAIIVAGIAAILIIDGTNGDGDSDSN